MADAMTYCAFGHRLSSEFPIEVLPPDTGRPADLQIRLRDGLIRPDITEPMFFDITPERQFFQWESVGAFLIEEPGVIWAEPNPGTPWRLVSQPLLGIVISVALERLGTFCLHGGAVQIGDRAAILLGDKGAGKSTTVSALLRNNRPLLTDDLVAIRTNAGHGAPMVQTGFPAIKLWPDSAQATDISLGQGAHQIHPSITKVQKDITFDAMARPTQVGSIFVLAPKQEGQTEAIRMDSTAAMNSLLYFAFIARFGVTSLGKAHTAGLMQTCAALVRAIPVYALHVRRDFDRLGALVDTIETVTGTSDVPAE